MTAASTPLDALMQDFEAGRVTPEAWNHLAHLRAALWYLDRSPDEETAYRRMKAGLLALNAAHKVPDAPDRGYHETLTRFWMKAVARYRAQAGAGVSLDQLDAGLKDALGDKTLVLRHYRRERLMSAEAKATYLPPDLDPR